MRRVMRKKIFIVVLLCLFAIALIFLSYMFRRKNQKNQEISLECTFDSDCGIGGCSGEVCTSAEKAREVVTICIWKPEFECLKLTSCRCIEGKCAWEENQAYKECVEKIKEEKCAPICRAVGTRSEGWYDSCTYKLIKWAKCRNESLKGTWCPEPRPEFCPYLLDPVCGVGKEIKEYANWCIACMDKNVEFYYKGEC